MSNHKTRLEKLEMSANGQPRSRIEIIEIHKPHEDGSKEVETWHLSEDGSWGSKEVTTYLKILPLDSAGNPIATVYLPDNGRDSEITEMISAARAKGVTTETD